MKRRRDAPGRTAKRTTCEGGWQGGQHARADVKMDDLPGRAARKKHAKVDGKEDAATGRGLLLLDEGSYN